MNVASRNQLIALLSTYFLMFITVAALFTHHAIAIAQKDGTTFEIGDLIIFGFSYSLLFNLLATLPLLMVVGYRGIQGPMVMERARASLALCGLSTQKVKEKMSEYTERNGFHAFLLPMAVNLVFMVLLWGAALLPHGMGGMLEYLEHNGSLKVGVDVVLLRVSSEAVAETWIFFGAYFYAITTLIRRWMQCDLTTNVLWKLNVRFAVSILLGFLLTALFMDAESSRGQPDTWLLGFAFLSGLVPDMFLRWLTSQVKRLGKLDDESVGSIFPPSTLRKKITGMSFWQADRLAEESVESVQDMAMKEIPDLLIHTRFTPALIFDWVDRALLWNQVGEATVWLEAIGIRSASQLVRLSRRQEGLEGILQAISDARKLSQSAASPLKAKEEGNNRKGSTLPLPPLLTRHILENVVSGLEYGPNLRYLCNYWDEVSYPAISEELAGNSSQL